MHGSDFRKKKRKKRKEKKITKICKVSVAGHVSVVGKIHILAEHVLHLHTEKQVDQILVFDSHTTSLKAK